MALSTDMGLISLSFQDANHKLIPRWTTQVNPHTPVEGDFLYQVELILDN